MCHVCKRTGIRECDPATAEIKCTICGFCERQALREQFQNDRDPGGIRDTEDRDD